MALTQPKSDAAEVLLAAYPAPLEQGQWADTARKAALARFRAEGAPGRRDEYWKFTNPSLLTAGEVAPAGLLDTDEAPVFEATDKLLLVFVDGVFIPELSGDLALEGVRIEHLSEATAKDIHWAKDVYGVLEADGQNPVPRPLAALNTAVATEGFLFHVTGKVSKPVCIRYVRDAEDADAVVHHVVKLDEGADITILENGPAAARFNHVLEVDVADGASFHHVRAQGRDHKRMAATHLFARLGRESSFKSFTLTVNGQLTRNECVISFNGDDAHATVAGASAGDGGDYHQDDTVFVTHDALNCESRQVFKKVLRNGATGVFQGKILVKEDAQKTDGYQVSHGLLLDDDCNFLAKPELEIYADDVACSHGSTCGGLDETAMFYLVSRGVPEIEAQDMLILAFLDDAIQEIEDESIAEDLRGRMKDWMERHRGQ